MMTKAQKILELHQAGKTTREIATRIYGIPRNAPKAVADKKMAYVRVVIRQRRGSASSEIDKRYWASPLYRTWRRKWRMERRAEELESV